MDSYHSPPEGISKTGEANFSWLVDSVFFSKVNKIRREDQTKKTNVQSCYEFLQENK